MKKTNLNGKLSLKKDTVSTLSNTELANVEGGKWFLRSKVFKDRCIATVPKNKITGCPTGY